MGFSSACFQISAAAIGTTKNGVIIIVRTTPRPRNLRSSRTATIRPSTTEIPTTETVKMIVFPTAWRSDGSVNTVL